MIQRGGWHRRAPSGLPILFEVELLEAELEHHMCTVHLRPNSGDMEVDTADSISSFKEVELLETELEDHMWTIHLRPNGGNMETGTATYLDNVRYGSSAK